MKLDNETIAISALVLALLLYYATRKVKTPEEIKRDDDHGRWKIILGNLETLEKAYDRLPGLKDRSVEQELPAWILEELGQMAKIFKK